MTRAMTNLSVVIVEDDATLLELLTAELVAEGWRVRTASRGDDGLTLCMDERPDIAVLDVMLPGLSGIEICSALRRMYNPPPGVVMVTALGSEVDVILGFDVGADDYVVKPCRPREIVARVRALGRRVRPAAVEPSGAEPAAAPDMHRGGLRIDLAARRVFIKDEPLKLTPTEFELLAYLASRPSQVFTRLQLLEAVWDSNHEGYARNVDCHITRVRRKLEAAGLDDMPIQTVHGVGYCFALDGGAA